MTPTQPFTAITPHVIAAIYLVVAMVQLGLELEPVVDRAEKRRERHLVLRALVLNFAVVPLLAVAVARLSGAGGPLALALLLLAAAPGGRHAPVLARTADADVGLAVEITLWSNKLNPILSPLLVAWMLHVRRADLRELTYIAELIGLQVVPYFGARLLRRHRPSLARQLARPARFVANAAGLALLCYLVVHRAALRSAPRFGVRGAVAILVFGALLLVLGWLAGGHGARRRRAFAITAEARNLALALVIGSRALGDEEVLLGAFAAWLILLAFGWTVGALVRARALPPAPAPPMPAR